MEFVCLLLFVCLITLEADAAGTTVEVEHSCQ
jgi:hypothetical protein